MSVNCPPDAARTALQWQTLHHTLLRLGAWVEYIEPQRGLPDLVYTANAGLTKGKKVVLSRFRHKERQGEQPHFAKWFTEAGYEVLEVSSGDFEGEGDALFAGDILFGGHGFRSDKAAFEEVRQLLGVKKVVLCDLTDPRFYHLDTCFCPISPEKAIYFPSAFTDASISEMKKNIELIPIPAEDAAMFACNSVVLQKAIIMPSGCDQTRKILEAQKFEVYPVALDEFLKGGGSAKCLSNRLDN